MTKTKTKQSLRGRRQARIRAKISGTSQRPRLTVFRSNKYIYAQLIDDAAGKTLAAARGRSNAAAKAGQTLAKAAGLRKIQQAVFDRGGYRYTGRVKALAEGARAAGLKF